MKVLICGISGLIGKAISAHFKKNGFEVGSIKREDLLKGPQKLSLIIEGSNVIINLAGAPVLTRWTNRNRNKIFESRVGTTRLLVSVINGMINPPGTFISVSAVGIYDGTNTQTENSNTLSNSFLGNVCQAWEAEAKKIKATVRLCIFRLGVVLSLKGGALKKMIFPFKLGLGGTIGNGNQYFPYIHINDVSEAFLWCVNNQKVRGVYNLVAPQIVRNQDFVKVLSGLLNRPSFFIIPETIIKFIYGKAAETIISGQQIICERLIDDGFVFNYPTLEMALTEEIKTN